jgi:uncharacterized membrane protein
LAIGYLFISINLAINGIGILLPTFVGYFIIAKTSYALRFKNKAFLYAVVPSAIMIALTFPQITFEIYKVDSYKYLSVPMHVFGYFILIAHCFGIYKCAALDNLKQVKHAIIGVLCLIPVSFILWYSAETLSIPMAVYFLIYESPKFFFALVLYQYFKKSG